MYLPPPWIPDYLRPSYGIAQKGESKLNKTYETLYLEALKEITQLKKENKELLEELEFASNRIALLEANNEIELK